LGGPYFLNPNLTSPAVFVLIHPELCSTREHAIKLTKIQLIDILFSGALPITSYRRLDIFCLDTQESVAPEDLRKKNEYDSANFTKDDFYQINPFYFSDLSEYVLSKKNHRIRCFIC